MSSISIFDYLASHFDQDDPALQNWTTYFRSRLYDHKLPLDGSDDLFEIIRNTKASDHNIYRELVDYLIFVGYDPLHDAFPEQLDGLGDKAHEIAHIREYLKKTYKVDGLYPVEDKMICVRYDKALYIDHVPEQLETFDFVILLSLYDTKVFNSYKQTDNATSFVNKLKAREDFWWWDRYRFSTYVFEMCTSSCGHETHLDFTDEKLLYEIFK